MGQDFSQVRVHSDTQAAAAARDLNAEAFTTGQDLYFGAGRYEPHTRAGRHLLAHELTHVIQQRTGAVQRQADASAVNTPGDRWEREADAVADRVADGRQVSLGVPASRPQPSLVQRGILDDIAEGVSGALDTAGDAIVSGAEAVGEAAGDVVDAIAGAAAEVIQFARELASVLGGAVSIDASGVTLTAPSFSICPSISLPILRLPQLTLLMVPLPGLLRVHDRLSLYGHLALNVPLLPDLSAHLNPCIEVHGVRVRLGFLGSFSASGSVTVGVSAGLSARSRANLSAQVGALIFSGGPAPFIIHVPYPSIGIEAGVTLEADAGGSASVTLGGAWSASLSGISASLGTRAQVGLAGSLRMGPYASVNILGVPLCVLGWPLWQWQGGIGVSAGVSAGVSLDLSGGSAWLDVDLPSLETFPFDQLQLPWDPSRLQDDCPLCHALYAAGLMPSQRGGAWKGHRTPPWAGPLHPVYERDPGLPSKAKCRGACGVDCKPCEHTKRKFACETTSDGRHRVWEYPNFESCGSHQGCRDHDECYDWCADQRDSILGPCHRLCDFECGCTYNSRQCAGWITGGDPHDRVMQFSDKPKPVGSCWGQCPGEIRDKAGNVKAFRYCLDPITLWDGIPLADRFRDSTRPFRLFQRTFIIPDVFIPVRLTVQAQGVATVEVGGTLGPISLENACLEMSPSSGEYKGSGELHIRASAFVEALLEGRIIGTVDIPCLVTLLQAIGTLAGRGRLALPIDGSLAVSLTCRDGELRLDAAAFIEVCAKLKASLEAALSVLVAGFEVYSNRWVLAEREWGKCWKWELGSTSGTLPLSGSGGSSGSGGAVPAARATVTGFGGGSSGGGGVGSSFSGGGGSFGGGGASASFGPSAPAVPEVKKAGLNARDILGTFIGLATQLEKITKAGSGADMPTSSEDLINEVCPVTPKEIECVKARPQDVTKITMSGTDRGENVTAEPLVQKPDPNNPPGRPSCTYNGKTAPPCLVGNRGWVRGHLLHGPTAPGRSHLNGPGTCPNLIMVDTSLNKKMRDDIEEMAITHLKKNEVLFYEASSEPFADTGDLRFIAKQVRASFGCMDPATGQKRQIHTNTYPLKDPPPSNCTA